MKTNIICHTNGKGLWTTEKRQVTVIRLEVGYLSSVYYPEDPVNGELRAYFDGSGFGTGSWLNEAYGLVYTDPKWLTEFKRGLCSELKLARDPVRTLDYSEHGMQGKDYVSLDFRADFWKQIRKHYPDFGNK